MTTSRTFSARYVFPVSGPPLANGTVTVTGDRIDAVLPRGARTPDEDFGNCAIIPGLVNPHTHLDLSGARGLIPPTDPDHFTDWLRGVIAYRRTRTTDEVQADIRAGLAECLRAGTTLLGDIAAEGASWEPLAASRVRAVVFQELIGLSDERAAQAIAKATHWIRSASQRWLLRRDGLSPHAPYSASLSLLTTAAKLCKTDRHSFAVHIAESPGEVELLRTHQGPFRDFLADLGAWQPDGLAPGFDEIVWRSDYLQPQLFIHGNYLSPHDRLPTRCASIVYCPRTHAAFGHPPHPFRDFLARGVRVCLGTDSLGSNPDLDILAEARFVRSRYPDFPGDQLLRMVTLSGAEALGWADETGSLDAGKSADFVVVPLPDADASDPHQLLLADHAVARRIMFRGEWRSTP